MIAIEIFFVLILVGLVAVVGLQHVIRKRERGHKGDAEKTPEEVESHRTRK